MILDSLCVTAGYFFAAAWLLCGVLRPSQPLKIFSVLCATVLTAWIFFMAFRRWVAVPGPAVVALLSVIFAENFRKTRAAVSDKFAKETERLVAVLDGEKARLETAEAVAADLQTESDKIISEFTAVKETLTRMRRDDLRGKISETVMRMAGVVSVAVVDKILAGEESCFPGGSAPRAAEEHLKTGSAPPGFIVSEVRQGARPLGAIVVETVEDASPAAKSAVSRVLSVFSLGYLRAALFDEYEAKSRRDGLTGIFNRRYMLQKLEMEIHRARRYGNSFVVVMLDVDHFKKINDTFGHPAGDTVLKKIAARLAEFDYPGAFAGRYGGEEFLVCLPCCAAAAAGQLAERARKAVSSADFPELRGKMVEFHVTASAGAAVFPSRGETAAEIISAADAALYEAKTAGRDRSIVRG